MLIILDDYIIDPQILDAPLQELKKKFDEGGLSEEELGEQLELLEDKHLAQEFEFVFLKEDNLHKQAAYPISISDWKLSDCLQS